LDESTEARLASYQTGFNNWKKYPILGWGVTGHSFLDAQYVKVLAETGAVGAIAFLLLLFKIFRVCRKMIIYTRERDEFYHSLSIGVLAGFIGLCGHALGTNTFIIIRIMEPFWLFMGIIVCIPRILSPPVVQAEAGK
jgi:O-antigen ligase